MNSSSRGPLMGIVFLVAVAVVAVVCFRFLGGDPVDSTAEKTGPSKVAERPKASELDDELIGVKLDDLGKQEPERAIDGTNFSITCLGSGGASDALAGVPVTATPLGPGAKVDADSVVTVATDAGGVALFENLSFKNYRIVASPADTYPLTLGSMKNGDDFRLVFEQGIAFNIKLVASDTNSPIENARVVIDSQLESGVAQTKLQNAIRQGRDTREVDAYDNRSFPTYSQRLQSPGSGALSLVIPQGYPIRVDVHHKNYDAYDEVIYLDQETGTELDRTYVLIPRTDIFGVVVDDVTGEPVAGALVEAAERGIPVKWIHQMGGENELFSATSDAEGKYRLKNVPRGLQHITVAHGDYEEFSGGFKATDLEPTEYEIRLRHPAALTGRVVDAANRPVAGAQVFWVHRHAMIFANNALAGQIPAVSSEDGQFTLTGVPANTAFHLIVRHSDFIEFSQRNLEVNAGQTQSDMEIVMVRGGSITGTVRDISTGKPLAGAKVTARPTRPPGTEMPRIKVADDGSFVVSNTKPGVYEVICEMEGYCKVALKNITDITSGIAFDMVRESVFAGKLINVTSGEPITKYNIRAKPSSVDRGARVMQEIIRDKDGQFELGSLTPGSWDFEFTSEETAPLLLTSVNFGEGEESRDQVLYATQGASAVGQVTNDSGAPVGFALVRFEQVEPFVATDKTYYNLQAHTDSNGNYTVPRLTPGLYKAWASHPRFAEITPLEITVEDGPETRVDITVPRSASLKLFIRDIHGNSVPRAKASLFRGHSPMESAEVLTSGPNDAIGVRLPDNRRNPIMSLSDAGSASGFSVQAPDSGELTWKRKEPGIWTLWVSAPGHDRYERSLTLIAGQESIEEAILYPTGTSPVDEKKDSGKGGRKGGRKDKKSDGAAAGGDGG